jgi:hypothetical protein
LTTETITEHNLLEGDSIPLFEEIQAPLVVKREGSDDALDDMIEDYAIQEKN